MAYYPYEIYAMISHLGMSCQYSLMEVFKFDI